jgi:hypothetical protein
MTAAAKTAAMSAEACIVILFPFSRQKLARHAAVPDVFKAAPPKNCDGAGRGVSMNEHVHTPTRTSTKRRGKTFRFRGNR